MAEYYNVTTNIGDAEITKAIANNTRLNITHIAFGDGNGSVPTPSKTRTTLVKEVHRQAVTKYEQHPTMQNWIVIETIIPSSIGGFWVREMGIIANGKLISHGSHAPFEKVTDPTGVSEYRLKFTQDVRDGNVVSIKLDESLIYASQAWVEEFFLRKTANAVSASKWQNERTVSFSGAATGSFKQDGSKDSSCVLTLANSGVVEGAYGSTTANAVLTIDAKGIIKVAKNQPIREASTTQTGVVQLVDALNDTSKNKAPTANQVKILNDRLNAGGVFMKAPTTTSGIDLLTELPDVCQTFTLSGTYVNAPAIFGNGSITGMIDVKKHWFDAGVQKILTIRHLSGQIWENVKNGETWGGWKRIDAIDKLDASASSIGSVKLDYLGQTKDKLLTGVGISSLGQGIHFDNIYGGTALGYPFQYGHRLTLMGQGQSASELYIEWASGRINIFARSKGDVASHTWTPMKQIAFTDSDITGNAATADKLKTARKIGGVGFDGSGDINLPGVNTTGNQNTNGNAATATKLQTPRNFNLAGDASGTVKFDGTSDVTLQVKLTNNALDVLAYSPIPYPKNIAPTGFLIMMGQEITQAQYPILFGLYGSRLPDMRGQTLRGWDNGKGIDTGRTLLSEQGDAIRNITGTYESYFNTQASAKTGAFYNAGGTRGGSGGNWEQKALGFDASLVVPTAPENRVKNIAFNYIVKAG